MWNLKQGTTVRLRPWTSTKKHGRENPEKYCDMAKKDKYTDDDYIEVYRIAEVEHYRSTGDRVLGNGASTTKRYFRDGGNEGNRWQNRKRLKTKNPFAYYAIGGIASQEAFQENIAQRAAL